jgi:hypothetical protein
MTRVDTQSTSPYRHFLLLEIIIPFASESDMVLRHIGVLRLSIIEVAQHENENENENENEQLDVSNALLQYLHVYRAVNDRSFDAMFVVDTALKEQ